MEQIINYTEEELTELRDELTTELSKMKGSTRRKKLKIIGKTLVKLVLIAGGVTVAILFPSTIVLAALGGVVAVLDGSKAPPHANPTFGMIAISLRSFLNNLMLSSLCCNLDELLISSADSNISETFRTIISESILADFSDCFR